MKITTRNDLPGYTRDSVNKAGVTLDVFLDGVRVDRAQTVDDERGFVDVVRGSDVHRLWGKVVLVWGSRFE